MKTPFIACILLLTLLVLILVTLNSDGVVAICQQNFTSPSFFKDLKQALIRILFMTTRSSLYL